MKTKNRQLIAFGLSLTALLFAIPFTANAKWDIRTFKVVQEAPPFNLQDLRQILGHLGTPEGIKHLAKDSLEKLQHKLESTPIDAENVAQLEHDLNQVARRYEMLGFPKPVIDYLTEDGSSFQAFVYNYSDALPAAGYLQRCEEQKYRSYFYIDSSRLLNNGKIADKFYEHLAHELFHAIQSNYPLFKNNCALGDWITEGTAEFMGIEMARRLRGIKDENPRVRMGGRTYSNALRVGRVHPGHERRNSAYWTSSLWRYIGEHIAAARGGGRAQAKATNPRDPFNPELRYLNKLFNRNLAEKPSENSELDWLDNGLKDIIGINLGRIYPNFITTFASYVPERAGADKPEYVDWWQRWLFGGCPQVSLSPAKLEASIPLDLPKVAAGCVILDIDVPDSADLMFHVDNLDRQDLRALSLGTAQGDKVGKSDIFELDEGTGKYFGAWKFRVPTDERQLFVISNVSRKASDTRAQQPVLQVTLASWESNMIQPSKGQPAARPAPPRQNRQNPDPTAVRNAKAFREGAQTLSSHVISGGTASRRSKEPPCADAFVYLACGPRTNITLSLLPTGAISSLGYVTGTGSSGAQVLNFFAGLAEAGPVGVSQDWNQAMMKLAEMEGSSVNISIPLIDYGFTGSYDNAHLVVSGKGRKAYKAIGPRDNIPGPGVAYRLSGNVTIEKYTPYILKGQFSGGLVDVENPKAGGGDDPAALVVRNVAGSFHIAGPWQGDRRTKHVPPEKEVLVQQMDLKEAFPAIASGMAQARLKEAGHGPGTSGSPGGGIVLTLSIDALLGKWLWTRMRMSDGRELKMNRIAEFFPNQEVIFYDGAGKPKDRGTFVVSSNEIRVNDKQVWRLIQLEQDRMHLNHNGRDLFFTRQ